MQQFTEIKEGNFICAKPSHSYVSFSFLGFLNVKGKSTVANLSLLDRRIWNRIEMVYYQYNLNSIEVDHGMLLYNLISDSKET